MFTHIDPMLFDVFQLNLILGLNIIARCSKLYLTITEQLLARWLVDSYGREEFIQCGE